MVQTLERGLEMKTALMKAIREDPSSVIRALLGSCFWLPSLSSDGSYRRFEDDSPEGMIVVAFTKDGDSWIGVISKHDPSEANFMFRFRMPLMGGGESPRVRSALLILAEAIRLDNEDHPQHRGG